MRVAISTDGDYVSAHFGRCSSFTIVDIEDGRIKNKGLLNNPGHQPHFLPKFLHQKGVECIIAGGMGVRAQEMFYEAGIQTILGVQGKIDDVIEQLRKGTLKGGESLCRPGSGKGYGLEKAVCNHPHGEHEKCEHKSLGINKDVASKICVSSRGDNLDSQVDPRFGRCPYFLIIDMDTMEYEAIKNPNIDAMGGAGIQSGQLVISKKVKTVLTGNVGPNAYQTLHTAGIQVFTGVSGTVKEAIEKFKKGDLKIAKGPTTGERPSIGSHK